MIHAIPSTLLRTALACEAAASGTLALLQITAPYMAARVVGVSLELLVGSGVILGACAALLIWMTSSVTVARALVRLVIIGNLAWAAACVAMAAFLSARLSPLGSAFLFLQAMTAIGFAVAQAAGLQRSPSLSRPTPFALKNTL